MSAETSIEVLLVDDNEQWGRFIAQDLERINEHFRVSVAVSANEALQRLHESDSYDCLVTDYQMPGTNGIQLLQRIRDTGWDIPVLLLTGEGGEDIAAEAISSGASDYLIKNPKAEQISIFEQRISAAVEQHRLQKSVAESEERYRTVTEQSSDAIVIVQDGRAVFWNRQLAEIVGFDESDRDTFDPIETLIHPDDRSAVRESIEDWYDGNNTGHLQETRIRTEQAQIRHWELAGRAITYDEEPAVLISARDVTQQKRQKRELEWEKELNRNIQVALVESRTREDLEAAICTHLHQYGYPLAWCGHVLDGELRPAVIRGGGSYTESVAFKLDDAHDGEPSVWAARSEEPVFVADFTELFATDWRDAALDAGYRSGAALPLIREDIFYGVLAVYDSRPFRFDEIEQSLLLSLADTVAFAIHSIETRHALSSRRIVELSLRLRGDEYYLNDVFGSVGGRDEEAQITVEGTVAYGDDRTVQYLTAEGIDIDAVRAAADEHPATIAVRTVWESEERSRLNVVIDGPTPESRLAELGVVVRETLVRAGGARVRTEVTTTQDRKRIFDQFKSEFSSVSVESIVETDRQAEPSATEQSLTSLTDKQAAALQAAFHQGYFESPRASSATEIAESLGVAHSTYLQHLRAAQRKVFEALYG